MLTLSVFETSFASSSTWQNSVEEVYTVRPQVPSSILVITSHEVQSFSPFNICASRTRQAGNSRKMLGFRRQIVDFFEAPCGNIDGKCTQSNRWQPAACSSKFFGEHRSISQTISASFLMWLPVVLFVRLFEPWIQVTHTSPPLQSQKHGIQTQDYHTEQVCRGASADTMWAGLSGRDCISSVKESHWKKGHSLLWIKYPSRVAARHLCVLLVIVRFKEFHQQQTNSPAITEHVSEEGWFPLFVFRRRERGRRAALRRLLWAWDLHGLQVSWRPGVGEHCSVLIHYVFPTIRVCLGEEQEANIHDGVVHFPRHSRSDVGDTLAFISSDLMTTEIRIHRRYFGPSQVVFSHSIDPIHKKGPLGHQSAVVISNQTDILKWTPNYQRMSAKCINKSIN